MSFCLCSVTFIPSCQRVCLFRQTCGTESWNERIKMDLNSHRRCHQRWSDVQFYADFKHFSHVQIFVPQIRATENMKPQQLIGQILERWRLCFCVGRDRLNRRNRLKCDEEKVEMFKFFYECKLDQLDLRFLFRYKHWHYCCCADVKRFLTKVLGHNCETWASGLLASGFQGGCWLSSDTQRCSCQPLWRLQL